MERIIRPTDKFRDNYAAIATYNTIVKTHDSVFLTGGAGTGKSTLLKLIIENVDKNFIVVAPTGIAAHNVNGKTINSTFNFPPSFNYPTDEFINSIKYHKSQKNVLWNLHLLIIDEISMVNPCVLDSINEVLKKIHNSSRPFGGVQVLFIGDLYQLPPVLNKDELKNIRYNWGSEFFFDSNTLKEFDYKIYELDQVYRQQNDLQFIELLNDIRTGSINAAELDLLNNSCLNRKHSNEGSVVLTTLRATADHLNYIKMKELLGKEYVYGSYYAGDISWNNLPAESHLHLKKKARVVFTKNNKHLGYQNGTLGSVISLNKDSIIVETDAGVEIDVPMEDWSEFKYDWDAENNKIVQKEVGLFRQYPLRVAYALTVHKTQGSTLKKVHFDVCNGAFSAGQVYVALSRCTSIDNLSFERPLKMSDIIVSKTVKDFFISKGQKNKLQGL
ncbi:ATP-dependent DNA helicase [Niabella aquatica]